MVNVDERNEFLSRQQAGRFYSGSKLHAVHGPAGHPLKALGFSPLLPAKLASRLIAGLSILDTPAAFPD
jgi:hypothetical protein